MGEEILLLQNFNIKSSIKDISWKKEINYSLKAKNNLLVTGPSGGGKSVFIKCLLDTYKATKLSYKGTLDLKVPFEFLSSENDVVLEKDVKYNLEKYYEVFNLKRNQTLLSSFLQNQSFTLNDKLADLSFGSQKRLCLYRSLSVEAPLMVLDEPTVGFDKQNVMKIQKVITELSKEKTFIVVTHDVNLVNSVNQILFINEYPYLMRLPDNNLYIKVAFDYEQTLKELFKKYHLKHELVFKHKLSPIIYKVPLEDYNFYLENRLDDKLAICKTVIPEKTFSFFTTDKVVDLIE